MYKSKDKQKIADSSSSRREENISATKSNAIEIPQINLPKGGGAIKSIDEKFSVNPANGTADFSIPLPISEIRRFTPKHALSYSSGTGNGIFGMGWSLNISSIKRKTEKELPLYFDESDSDTFIISGADDLIPEFKKDNDGKFIKDSEGKYVINESDRNFFGIDYKIRRYRPRIEGLFARIERWTEKPTGLIHWRVINKTNVTSIYGKSPESRVADPLDDKKIFEWRLEFTFDDKGNCTLYDYKKEDEKGFNASLLHNRNRKNNDINYTNCYLKRVLYGIKSPYKNKGETYSKNPLDYLFEIVFNYGEHDTLNAPFNEIRDWDFRIDAFSEYRSGFEIRTCRLCKSILLYHRFAEFSGGSALVKSIDLVYDNNGIEGFTFLKDITVKGYIKHPDSSYTQKSLPSLSFKYQKHEWNTELKLVSPENLIHAPVGIDEANYQFVDLYSEGLAGILTEQGSGWFYKNNMGEGNFTQAKLIAPKPSVSGMQQKVQLMELEADGVKHLVQWNDEPKGYFELTSDEHWQPFKPFEEIPNINRKDANIRFLDLNGDGLADLLITEQDVFIWYPSHGKKGFGPSKKTIKPFDEEKGPALIFADGAQSVFLADMNGDGLTDIVRIRNSEISYWPNLGYGRFGAKVGMDNAPWFDHPENFNPSFIKLADLDGSGTTDIIYLGKNKFNIYLNQQGNSFADEITIDSFPEINSIVKIELIDLLGTGLPCIVWNSSLPVHASHPQRYIDLMNSKKPHLMVSYENNLGKEINFEYTPSTKFYIEDKLADKPWVTKLPFPVYCISKTEIRDNITGSRFVSRYKYHHGFYDHVEKEFRGFGMVEQTDTEHYDHWVKGNSQNIVEEALHQQPVLLKSWFHTGAFSDQEKILNQFAHEYWYEEMNRKGFAFAFDEYFFPGAKLVTAPGIDSSLINELTIDDWREASRSCKSAVLRTEVFSLDAPEDGATSAQIKKQLTPHIVGTHNCIIEIIQPKGQNKHGAFMAKESEAITYTYERNSDDPRIAHTLNIKVDEYGNILESASIVYPRIIIDTAIPAETQMAQDTCYISYSQNSFTNDINTENDYRLRLPSEEKTYELKGVSKSSTFYSPVDFNDILDTSTEVHYHEININPAPGTSQIRLVEHVRTLFYKNDLTGVLGLHQLQSLALPFENYQLAYTPELLDDIFGIKVNSPIMLKGKFTHTEGDANWWIPSGTIQYLDGGEIEADAQNRFYFPIAYTDPYGAKTKIKYFSDYFLFIEETEDAFQNKSRVLSFNLRTLLPQRIMDANENITEALTDELGLVKTTAVFGKGNNADDLSGINEYVIPAENLQENDFINAVSSSQLTTLGKDLLKHASARFVYDYHRYVNSGGKEPAVSCSILREEHFIKNNNSPIQLSFEYSNGLGDIIMKKVQAEPGIAKQLVLNPDDTYTILETDTSASLPKQLRWIGNGRTVLNNKGKAVKRYEPYFSITHKYESVKELVENGVTPVLYYDALGRLVRMEAPDGTFSKMEINTWKQSVYDQNDTILESSWYNKRLNNLIDSELTAADKDPIKEKEAAVKAAHHANTPSSQHFDTLGRPVLLVEHNGKNAFNNDILFFTKNELDVEGNMRSVTDERGNKVVQYKFDLLGNIVYEDSMDSGKRWKLQNIMGNPLRMWDERNHELLFDYDILHRPAIKTLKGGDGPSPLNNIIEMNIYGENLPNDVLNNFRTKAVIHYDTAGKIETTEFDFKGNPLSSSRRFAQNYKETADWSGLNPDAKLETEIFTSIFDYDAQNRITSQTVPDSSIFIPQYNEAGLLDKVQVTQNGNTEWFVKNIDYNEKMQRKKITYGNDISVNYFYDKETFRLNHIETKRLNNDQLQDLYYTFDPAGNITHIEDKNIPDIFFNNQKISGTSSFTYDALYRLIEATGREHIAQVTFGAEDNWNDLSFMKQYSQNDPMIWRNYTQKYFYDSVGNISQMRHLAQNGNWTRDYNYAATNNRLNSTIVGTDTYNYVYHPSHGFAISLPHLKVMRWNFKNELLAAAKQSVISGTPETTYYVYDSNGQRTRKITERQAGVGVVNPSKKSQRIYVGGIEIYREYDSANSLILERQTCHVMDDKSRIAMIETRTQGIDDTPQRLVRFQHDNHLNSACIETNTAGQVISYEEYHPFGTTSYQAVDKDIKAAYKRYRYTSMERDEESGLEYHGVRYYLPWLGRWFSPDPIGIEDGINVYAYVRCNPLSANDKSGKQAATSGDIVKPRAAAGDLAAELAATPETQTPVDLSPNDPRPSTGSSTLDDILNGFDTVSRWIRNYLPGIIAAPLAGIVEFIGGLVELIGGLFTWNSNTALHGLKEMGLGLLRIVGFREVVEDEWVTGRSQGFDNTDLSLPKSMTRDLGITRSRVHKIAKGTEGRNGMHAWHASTNAILANRMGPIGVIFLFIAGLVHESPIDWGSFQAEQYWQGTVNHILDSFMDIIANIFGILIGLLIPRRWSVYVAALLGNQIPGPGEPDKDFGGDGIPYHGTTATPRSGDPRRTWGQYPPPIGAP